MEVILTLIRQAGLSVKIEMGGLEGRECFKVFPSQPSLAWVKFADSHL
jgi:hypothetical protein